MPGKLLRAIFATVKVATVARECNDSDRLEYRVLGISQEPSKLIYRKLSRLSFFFSKAGNHLSDQLRLIALLQ